MTTASRRLRRGLIASRTAIAAAVLISIVAACGTSVVTPAPTAVPETPTPTATPTATPVPSPTIAPLASIVPVPTSALAAAGTPAAHLDASEQAALQKALDSMNNSAYWPGSAAAIVFPDGSVWAGHTGWAVNKKTEVADDTLFAVGSISKTFVAALAGRLAMRGTISLDDKLSKYVPTFPNAAAITLRQLLNHTSGIQDVFDAPGMASAILAKPSAVWTTDQVLAKIGKPYFAPGAGYHYSNTNFILLGAAIEKATGKTIAELVRTEFLTPLGLDKTFLQTEEQAVGPLAHGYMGSITNHYDTTSGPMIPFTAEATAVGPAGAYVSTATDIARWGHALYSGQVLDPATLASMVDISPSMAYASKPPWPYGLGTEEATINGHMAWGHRGHLDGFWSSVWYLPDSGICIAVVTNAQWADPVAAAAKLAVIVTP